MTLPLTLVPFALKGDLLPLLGVTVSDPDLPLALTSYKFWYPMVMK